MKKNGLINTELKASEVKDRQPVSFHYLHTINKEGTQDYGTRFGQNLEPAGKYIISVDKNIPRLEESERQAYEYGTITFESPLVIEHKSTDDKGWKKDLSDKYGKTGKELSNAIRKDGYDGIITVDSEKDHTIEIISLMNKKLFRGGELEDYQRGKDFDWSKLPNGKELEKMYRLYTWLETERIEEYKFDEDDWEFLTESYHELVDADKVEDRVLAFIDDYRDIGWARGDKDVEKTRDSFLKAHGITLKEWHDEDVSDEELAEKISDKINESDNVLFDLLTQRDSYNEFEYRTSYEPQDVVDLYDKILEEGLVFTEEAEEQQYDLFQEKEPPKEKSAHEKLKDFGFYLSEDGTDYRNGESDNDVYIYFEDIHNVDTDDKVFYELPTNPLWYKNSPDNFSDILELTYEAFKDKKYHHKNKDWLSVEQTKERYPNAKYDALKEKSLKEEIELELDFLYDLLEDAQQSDNQTLTEELELQIEFLEDLQEDTKTLKDGGLTASEHNKLSEKWAKELSEPTDLSKGMTVTEIDEKRAHHYRKGNPQEYNSENLSEINIIFNNKYDTPRLDFVGVLANGKKERVGWADSKLYIPSINVLNLHEVYLVPQYDNQAIYNKVLSLIKENYQRETGKTELIIDKSRY